MPLILSRSRALRLAWLPCSHELQDAELGDFHQGCSYLTAITRHVPVFPPESLFAQQWGSVSKSCQMVSGWNALKGLTLTLNSLRGWFRLYVSFTLTPSPDCARVGLTARRRTWSHSWQNLTVMDVRNFVLQSLHAQSNSFPGGLSAP